MSFFLDSNILIYAFSNVADHQEKRHAAARLLARRDWCLSAQVLQEFYANIIKPRHALTLPLAIAAINEITKSRPVCPIDTALILNATEIQARYQLSYWDAAILAAAKRMRCTRLITEDLNHEQDYGGVIAINPFIARKQDAPLA